MVPEKIVFSQWIQYFSQPQPGMEHFLWIICFVQTPAAPRLLHWDTVPSHCGGHGSEWWFRWPLMNCLQSDIPLYCINYKANHAAWIIRHFLSFSVLHRIWWWISSLLWLLFSPTPVWRLSAYCSYSKLTFWTFLFTSWNILAQVHCGIQYSILRIVWTDTVLKKQ